MLLHYPQGRGCNQGVLTDTSLEGKVSNLSDSLHLAAFRLLHRHQQVQVRLPCLGILGLHMDSEGLHKIPEKAPYTQSLQSRNARDAAGAGTSVPPHLRGPRGGAQVHRRAPRRPPRLCDPGPEERGGDGEGAGPRGRPCRTPRRAREQRGRQEKGCSGRGGAAVGEGSAARTLTHRLTLLPARALRRSPLRLSPPASSPKAQRPAGTRGAAEKSARAEGVQRAELRGWEGWDSRSRRRRGHHRHGSGRLLSATEAAGPPTTPASRPPQRPLEN